jgi:hypothetical protein
MIDAHHILFSLISTTKKSESKTIPLVHLWRPPPRLHPAPVRPPPPRSRTAPPRSLSRGRGGGDRSAPLCSRSEPPPPEHRPSRPRSRPPARRTTTTTLPPLPPLPSPPRAPAIGREYHHHAGPQGMYSLSLGGVAWTVYSSRSDLARGYFRVNYAGHRRGREKQRMQKGVRAAEVEDPALPLPRTRRRQICHR